MNILSERKFINFCETSFPSLIYSYYKGRNKKGTLIEKGIFISP